MVCFDHMHAICPLSILGPCQFPTLGFVVQRYNQVKEFKPETFWFIYLTLKRVSASQDREEEIKFNWKRHHLFFKQNVLEILRNMIPDPLAKVVKVTKKNTKKWLVVDFLPVIGNLTFLLGNHSL